MSFNFPLLFFLNVSFDSPPVMCWWENYFHFSWKILLYECGSNCEPTTKPRKRSFTFCLLSNAFWRKKNVQVEVEGCDDPQKNSHTTYKILCNFLSLHNSVSSSRCFCVSTPYIFSRNFIVTCSILHHIAASAAAFILPRRGWALPIDS